MRRNYERATLALGEVLSTPAGFMLMYNYVEADHYASHAADKLRLAKGKRPTKREVDASVWKGHADGEFQAYRDALAILVVEASGYEVSRRDAVRVVNKERREYEQVTSRMACVDVTCSIVDLFY